MAITVIYRIKFENFEDFWINIFPESKIDFQFKSLGQLSGYREINTLNSILSFSLSFKPITD